VHLPLIYEERQGDPRYKAATSRCREFAAEIEEKYFFTVNGFRSGCARARSMERVRSGKVGEPGLPDLSCYNAPKRDKINQMAIIYIPNGRKIDQTDIKYTYTFHGKSIKKLPKFGFLV
jgi:hypothetical protein